MEVLSSLLATERDQRAQRANADQFSRKAGTRTVQAEAHGTGKANRRKRRHGVQVMDARTNIFLLASQPKNKENTHIGRDQKSRGSHAGIIKEGRTRIRIRRTS